MDKSATPALRIGAVSDSDTTAPGSDVRPLACAPTAPLRDPPPLETTVSADSQLLSIQSLADSPVLLPTDAQIGRFIIVRLLGAGGMGAVYEARDPELDRSVALKLLPNNVRSQHLRQRLVREAQALAQLQHPNVVGVHEVGIADGRVFIVMELVDGVTLDDHLKQGSHDWREIIALFVQAGRGLAAAHTKGIVHRDFKPGNVLVDRERRVRVSDFGLARLTGPEDCTISPDDPLTNADTADLQADDPAAGGARRTRISPGIASQPLTDTGALVGTPRYMAPEQYRGERADARSDQFSFCVALWVALFGQHPFAAGDQLGGLAATVPGAQPRTPPRGRAPRWLVQLVLRGLRVEQAGRHPSMAALVSALTTIPLRRRRLAIAASAVAVAGATIAVAVALSVAVGGSAPLSETCVGGPSLITAAWPDRAAAVQRLATLGPYGPDATQRVAAQLDTYAARWAAGHRDACLSHRRGLQSDDLLDRRMACLDRGRGAFTALAGVVSSADRATLPGTVVAAYGLPNVDDCRDTVALLAAVPPPLPAKAARAAEIHTILDRTQVLGDAGRYEEADRVGGEAVSAARALDYPPLLARALLVHGRSMRLLSRDRAGEILPEAARLAIELGDDAMTIEAWSRAASARGTGSGTTTDALDGLDLVAGMVRRPGTPPFARALFYANVGYVDAAHGRRERARAWFDKAHAESLRVKGPAEIELVALGRYIGRITDDPTLRDAVFRETEQSLERRLGPDHPEVLLTRGTRTLWERDLAAAAALSRPNCDRMQRVHQIPHDIQRCWLELAFVADELGNHQEAVAAIDAAAITTVAMSQNARAAGYRALWRGEAKRAAAIFAEASANSAPGDDKGWWQFLERGENELGLGRSQRAAGDLRGARTALERAIADLDHVMSVQSFAAIERRRVRAHAELAYVLVAARYPAAQVRVHARTAAAGLRAMGGRADEIAALEAMTH